MTIAAFIAGALVASLGWWLFLVGRPACREEEAMARADRFVQGFDAGVKATEMNQTK